jgi:DNA repair exonuclease SbcCD ATPase subunit
VSTRHIKGEIMLYVERVVGNVKGGADVKIGRCTLISGPNGSGKSTIVNIIELALMGFASDIVGRPEVRKGADLITLAPEEENLTAEVYTSENDRASFTVERNGPGKTREPVHVGLLDVAVVWPIREAVSALRGSAATARSFVLRHSGLNIDEASILARFGDEETRNLYVILARGVQAQAGGTADPVDTLLGVQEEAKATERAIKAKAKGAKEVIEQTSANLTVDYSADDEKSAQDEINRLSEKLAEYRVDRKALQSPPAPAPVAAPAVRPLGPTKAQLAEALNKLNVIITKNSATLTALGEEYGQIEAVLAETAPTRTISPEQVEGVIAADSAYAYHQKQTTLNQCVVCWQPWQPGVEVLAARRQQFSGVLTAYREQEQGIEAWNKQAQAAVPRKARLLEDAQRISADNEEKQRAYAGVWQQYNDFVEPVVEPPAEPPPPVVAPDFTEIDGHISRTTAELEEARRKLASIQQIRTSWGLVRKAQKQVIEAKREADAAKNLGEQAGLIADALLSQGRAGFVARVQAFLPQNDKFDVVLKDGKRAVCLFGFRREGVLHTALSGAEWARLTIALGAAIIPTEGKVLAILTPEERAFDPDTLGAVMEALKAAPGQVILTSPVAPPHPVEGWTTLVRG